MSEILRLKKDEFLCEKGEASNEIFILRAGQLTILEDGKEVETLKPISMVGEISFIEKLPIQRTVIANTPCTLMVINRELFDGVFSEMPDWYMALYDSVLKRLKSMGYGDIV